MYCPSCKTTIPDDSAFCSKCGKPLEVPSVPAPVSSCISAATPARKRRRWPWIVALAIVGALVLFGAAALAFTQIERIVGDLVLPESSASQYSADSATASASDPIVGHWQGWAASTSEHDLTLLGAGASDDFYIEFMSDGTLVASLDGSETYDGIWVANGTMNNEPCYSFTMAGATWTCVMTERIDSLDTALVAVANDAGGQECSITYRRS